MRHDKRRAAGGGGELTRVKHLSFIYNTQICALYSRLRNRFSLNSRGEKLGKLLPFDVNFGGRPRKWEFPPPAYLIQPEIRVKIAIQQKSETPNF